MQNRLPTAPNAGAPLPAFAPVPRKCARHDGWTPARQRAFVEALADTGSVTRAAAQVNMSPEGAYYLRRQPGAEGFRAAWEAALDYGVARMKDIAFERAIAGHLVPVITGGKLIGYRRIYNDRLLMFCLRHYGQDASGKRTKIEYFSTRASAAASATPLPSEGEGDSREARAGRGGGTIAAGGAGGAIAEASTTTVTTVITGGTAADRPTLDETAALIDTFDPAALDDTARAAIAGILAECAARRTAELGTPDDPEEILLAAAQPPREVLVYDVGYPRPRKVMISPPPIADVVVDPAEFLEREPHAITDPGDQYRASDAEMPWTLLDDEAGMERIEEAVASVKAAKRLAPPREGEGDHHRADGDDGGGPEAAMKPPAKPRSEPVSKRKRRKKGDKSNLPGP